MKLHELREPKGTKKARKRRGRGAAAGQGKTAGFGTKGSGSRGKLYFEGGQLPLVNRLPHRRGFRNINRVAYSVVNVEALNRFEPDSVVDAAVLIESKLVRNDARPIKVLGRGELDRSLTVKVDKCSATARAKIEAAGGAVDLG